MRLCNVYLNNSTTSNLELITFSLVVLKGRKKHKSLSANFISFIICSKHTFLRPSPGISSIMKIIFSFYNPLWKLCFLITGLKAIQHCGEVGLYIKDFGLWFGTNCRHNFHDDAICRNALLSSSWSHSRNGIQGECRHLVSGWVDIDNLRMFTMSITKYLVYMLRLYNGRNDKGRCPLPRHRSHWSME